MSNIFLKAGILLFLALGLAACKSKKVVVVTPTKTDEGVNAWKMAEESRLNYKTLTARGKGNLESPEQSVSFTYRINIAKDSLINVSCVKVGLEFLSVLIDRDSVFIRMPTEKRAIVCDHAFLSRLTGLNTDISYIQNLITGDLTKVLDTMKLASSEPPAFKYDGSLNGTNISYFISNEFFKLVKIQVDAPADSMATELIYRDFQVVQEQKLPMSMFLQINSKGKTTVDLSHNQVEFDPVEISFNFRIPKSYEIEVCGKK